MKYSYSLVTRRSCSTPARYHCTYARPVPVSLDQKGADGLQQRGGGRLLINQAQRFKESGL